MEKSSEPTRWWDWPAIGLLFMLLQLVAARLVATDWTDRLGMLQFITTMAYFIGLALGYSQFRPRTARWLSFFYMIVLLPLQWTTIFDKDIAIEERLLSVGGRLIFSTGEFFARKPVEDPLFFLAAMSIAFWAISASAGFRLTREQHFLAVVLPAATGLLILQHYDNRIAGRLWFLGAFFFGALFLLGRLNFLRDKKHWQQKRVFLSPENGVDLTSGIGVAAALIIILAWSTPLSITQVDSLRKAWTEITKPWERFTNRMENAVSALESTSNTQQGDFYGTELQLGTGFPLSDTQVFDVQVPELAAGQKPPRFYWRGRVYDYFDKNQWYTTGTTSHEFSPVEAEPNVIQSDLESTLARFIFRTGNGRFSLLYSPQQPVWVSRGGTYRSAQAGSEVDIYSWSAAPSLLSGETYQVDAHLINPNLTQLRNAGTDYPEWVTEKYLQLPQSFSPRIQELAAEITANADTPYDKASAITRYLRDNIEYEPVVPAAPRNLDTLEWILFEHKKAYCVYYASSEILMLRSLGIPARMAVGFAQGEGVAAQDDVTGLEEDFIPGRYSVRKKNAHAWPEVYFPGIGWVEFEPTGNQSPLTRPIDPASLDGNTRPPNANLPLSEDELPVPPESDTTTPVAIEPVIDPRVLLFGGLTLLSLGIVALLIYFGQKYAVPQRIPGILRTSFERSGARPPRWLVNWDRWVALSPIEKSFESINFGLRSLNEAAPVHATPSERADRLSKIMPPLKNQIKVLLDEHQTSLYTSGVADAEQAQQAASHLRMQVLLARLRHLFTGSYFSET